MHIVAEFSVNFFAFICGFFYGFLLCRCFWRGLRGWQRQQQKWHFIRIPLLICEINKFCLKFVWIIAISLRLKNLFVFFGKVKIYRWHLTITASCLSHSRLGLLERNRTQTCLKEEKKTPINIYVRFFLYIFSYTRISFFFFAFPNVMFNF